jgi:hypothetical protein
MRAIHPAEWDESEIMRDYVEVGEEMQQYVFAGEQMRHDAQHDHQAKIQRRTQGTSQDAEVRGSPPTCKLGDEVAMIRMLGSSVRCEKLLHACFCIGFNSCQCARGREIDAALCLCNAQV